MNTSLTLPRSEISLRQPTWAHIFAAILAFVASLFSAGDDPAAVHYMLSKYDGESD